MPRITITEENRSRDGGDQFPRMKLDTGEKARFILFEQPWSEYVHELKAPVLENGVGVRDVRTRKDNSTYEVWKTEFLRRSICLGIAEITLPDGTKEKGPLEISGVDPDNCPACKASVDSGGNVARPVQRFAANVIRYDLKGSTWQLRVPFSASIELWSFTSRMWDSLITLQNKIGALNKHDLTLECEDGHWQRNLLSFEMDPGYIAAGGAGYIKQLLADPSNRANDDQLRDACGSVAARAYLQGDVDLILGRWRQVENAGSGSYQVPVSTQPADLGTGLDALLASPGTPAGALDDPMSVFMTQEQQAAAYPTTGAPGAAVPAQPPASTAIPAAVPFDDPFAGLVPASQLIQQPALAQAAVPSVAAVPNPVADAYGAATGQVQVQQPGQPVQFAPAPAQAPVPQAAQQGDLDFETLLGM